MSLHGCPRQTRPPNRYPPPLSGTPTNSRPVDAPHPLSSPARQPLSPAAPSPVTPGPCCHPLEGPPGSPLLSLLPLQHRRVRGVAAAAPPEPPAIISPLLFTLPCTYCPHPRIQLVPGVMRDLCLRPCLRSRTPGPAPPLPCLAPVGTVTHPESSGTCMSSSQAPGHPKGQAEGVRLAHPDTASH